MSARALKRSSRDQSPLTAADDDFELLRTIHPSAVDKLVEGFKDFTKAVAQLVDNAADWGATEVILRFGKQNGSEYLSCSDNGVGFSDVGLHAIVSLGMSGAKDDPEKKGKNGTGAKAAVTQCERVTIETKRADTQLLTVDFTVNELRGIICNGDATKGMLRRSQLPPRHAIKTTGSVITWWGLKSRPASKRTAAHIVQHLAEFLTPQYADKVVVEDTATKSRMRLKPRSLIGKRIRGDKDVPGVGTVHYDLAVAAEAHASGEFVRVTALGTGCVWQKFIEPLLSERRLAKLLCTDVMTSPNVMGFIDIPSWNKRFASNSRDGFDADLYADAEEGTGGTLLAFLKWVRVELVPTIAKELGITQGAPNDSQLDQTLQEVVALIHERTGKQPVERDVQQIDTSWDTSLRRIILERGESIDIEITGPRDGARYEWDASSAGGTVKPAVGTRVTFTAGRTDGTFSIIVRESGKPPVERKIAIHVREELKFAISPPAILVECGEEKALGLRYTRRTSGRFTWITGNAGGEATPSADGRSATYRAGRMPGDYTITVEDAEDADHSATCRITVLESLDRGRETRRNEFPFGDHKYRVDFAGLQMTSMRSYLFSGSEYSNIRINSLHPSFQFVMGNPLARKYFCLNEIALRIAQNEDKTSPPSALQERAAEILAKLLPA